MNKKGFTLIEIIICLVLIMGIGIVSVVTISKKENNKLEEITNKIIEAANVYINTEKDDKGNYYSYGINNGAKGVQISVKTLEETGYISKGIVSTLEKESGKKIEDGLYVFVSNTIKNDTDQECSSGIPQSYTVSWESTDETVYLCPYEPLSGGCKVFNDDKAIYNKVINQSFSTECSSLPYHSGLCFIYGEDYVDNNVGVYYYKGKAQNNYLKFDGLEKLFRIVRTTENDSIKIIEEDRIQTGLKYGFINEVGLGCDLLFTDELASIEKKPYRGYTTYISTCSDDSCYSSLRSSANVSKICMKDFLEIDKVVLFYTGVGSLHPYVPYNSLPTNNETFESWGYDGKINFFVDFKVDDVEDDLLKSSTIQVHSPINKFYYEPLNANYSTIKSNIESYLDENYEWCIKDATNFKCSSKKIKSDFGLLTYSEYELIMFGKMNDYEADDEERSVYETLLPKGLRNDSDLTMDLKRIPAMGCRGCNSELQYFRPSYVIKGNSKVISGDGTKDNPYVVSGLTD